jgi:hypothetical protein
MSRSNRSPSQSKIEEIRRRVRSMPAGGDLDALLNEACDEFERLFREEMLAEREKAVSPEADFPPSGVSELRTRTSLRSGPETSPDSDARR